ncbi:MAG: molybdate ABC transporter substrate-binding protein [Acidimicrobiia bacterium]|nr:molybdate ABC transporter substrate-binding protein [Acidimicrobiia bacterium]
MTIGVLQSAALGVALAAIAIGCGDASADDSVAGSGEDTASGELLVFAAASLTDAFGDIEDAFEKAFPDVEVQLNLAGSSTLREQILGGAPASVFASADETRMDEVVEAELIAGIPMVFASNTLTIAVPTANPAGITSLDDFADPPVLVGACAVGVPCGDLSAAVFTAARVDPSIDTYEPDVRSLLAKIADGELDTGLVYVTDVAARADAVDEISLPPGIDIATSYPIATLLDAPNPEAAALFVEYVLSDEGRRILTDHRFGTP